MDNAPDAPANSTLDEQRPRGTVEQQLASFGPHSGEPPEPEEPEGGNERDSRGGMAGSPHRTCRRRALL